MTNIILEEFREEQIELEETRKDVIFILRRLKCFPFYKLFFRRRIAYLERILEQISNSIHLIVKFKKVMRHRDLNKMGYYPE